MAALTKGFFSSSVRLLQRSPSRVVIWVTLPLSSGFASSSLGRLAAANAKKAVCGRLGALGSLAFLFFFCSSVAAAGAAAGGQRAVHTTRGIRARARRSVRDCRRRTFLDFFTPPAAFHTPVRARASSCQRASTGRDGRPRPRSHRMGRGRRARAGGARTHPPPR